MAALHGEMALLDTAIDAEGQVFDPTTAWSACMTDAGHPWIARPVDALTVITEQAWPLLGPPAYDGGTWS